MSGEHSERSRGRLRHVEAGNAPQFITWRCADSIPIALRDEIIAETEALPPQTRNLERASRYEKACDQGFGACPLRSGAQGGIVQDYLLAHDGVLYDLIAWAVMPNHVHAVLSPRPDKTLAEIMQRIKGATARYVNEARGVQGTLWQSEYYDRLIRDDDHLQNVVHYIHWNPVKAKLCVAPSDFQLSSAKHGKYVTVVREARAPYGDAFDPFLD